MGDGKAGCARTWATPRARPGLIPRPTARRERRADPRLSAELPRNNVWLAGRERLGTALLEVVENNLWRVLVPMIALLLFSLWLAFRRVSEVALSLFTLAFSLFCLFAIMRLAGWSWNLLNLMALPLLLGSALITAFTCNWPCACTAAISRTLAVRWVAPCCFAPGTTVAGFGSNIWSSNGGLVSLGQVCATGIALAYLTSTWLLPILVANACSRS